MNSIGHPKNYKYFPLHNLLSQQSRDNSWTTTFGEVDNFFSYAKKEKFEFNKEEEYLSLLSIGLKKAIEQPKESFDCVAARKTYNTVVGLLNQHLSKEV